eukprot:gene10711-3333_t
MNTTTTTTKNQFQKRKSTIEDKIQKLEKRQKMIQAQIQNLTSKKSMSRTELQIERLTKRLSSRNIPEDKKLKMTKRLEQLKSNGSVDEVASNLETLEIKQIEPKVQKEISTSEKLIKFDTIKELFIDGNNMLYIYNTLRKLVLGKQRNSADQLLVNFFKAFHEKVNFQKTIVMYDDTKLKEWSENNFTLLCARPNYKTSDDYLVELASKGLKPESMLFVTSDVELKQRLLKYNVQLSGPKTTVIQIAKEFFDIESTEVDAWLKKFE